MYSGADGCHKEEGLRLDSWPAFTFQVGEGGKSTFPKICYCQGKKLFDVCTVENHSGGKSRTTCGFVLSMRLYVLSADILYK